VQLQTGGKPKPTINVTSLIDVLFLLLTFFIVTTRFVEQSALKVELPETRNAERVQQMQPFVLNIAADGAITFQDKTITENDLQSELSRVSEEIESSGGLVLRADLNLSHGQVMKLYDQIRGAGVKRVAVATSETVK